MIHKEGYKIAIISFLILAGINIILFFLSIPLIFLFIILFSSLLILLFILRFFRIPKRIAGIKKGTVYSPADGKVVVIEETMENEYFKKKMIQVSIFMSVWNVHINWFPINGKVIHYKYHPGKYLVARHPKSSSLNERNTTVIQDENGNLILLRQIAGYVARRVVSYARVNNTVTAGQEMGFIKFGSRVDIFLPTGTDILVKPGQKVKGTLDPIALIS